MLFKYPNGATRLATGFALLIPALLLVGCGGTTTAKVTGVVKYKGDPLPSGSITFIGPEGSSAVVPAMINEDGTYSLEAPLGDCMITVSTGGSPSGGPAGSAMMPGEESKLKDAPQKEGSAKYKDQKEQFVSKLDKMAPGGASPMGSRRVVEIPKKYSDAKTSGLKYTVKKGPNTYNIDLQEETK